MFGGYGSHIGQGCCLRNLENYPTMYCSWSFCSNSYVYAGGCKLNIKAGMLFLLVLPVLSFWYIITNFILPCFCVFSVRHWVCGRARTSIAHTSPYHPTIKRSAVCKVYAFYQGCIKVQSLSLSNIKPLGFDACFPNPVDRLPALHCLYYAHMYFHAACVA